ncbi:S-layer homology domain-containing protein [Natronincola peptidivorans]|uniref:S-layer homology domain-containing protein n=1 Tax=Natronincola peptidivorans TaxID=426128 RepID=A0A1I0CR48_9FIRM|nr:S-layer homology domain-containing protein [Natronincola peptidivorans]SET22251.1 S-layer homology domain-containing protein [Natronincola peptidivorans]
MKKTTQTKSWGLSIWHVLPNVPKGLSPWRSVLTLLLILTFSLQAYALEIPGYEGGIQNETTYREVIFLTGEPIIVEGTVSVSDRGDRVTYNYRNLVNTEKNVSITRNVTLDKETISNGSDQKQQALVLNRYRETITVNGVRYETSDAQYPWSKAQIFHEKPGVTYFAGNWDGRKTYTINRNQGTVRVDTQGTVVGYDHHWGATNTQTVTHFIRYERAFNNNDNEEETLSWEGTAEVSVVHNRTKDYHYEANTPTQISFRGGYLLTEKEENIVKYSYNLPRLGEDGDLLRGRNSGSRSFSLDTNPINKRLTIPAMRDISGHWAEKDILFLASLEALAPHNSNFGPSLPMSRGEFARALAVIMGLEKEEEQPARRRTVQLQEPTTLFVDVPTENPNQKYIEAVFEKGIMKGVGEDHFMPNQSITKAEATVAIIKALGFEDLAPIQQYAMGYRDDYAIPLWARDAIYVAREMGLVDSNPNGYFQPSRDLTKAETVDMLTRLVHYLQWDIRYDYRERILNY